MAAGLAPRRLATREVRGRRSGRLRSFPVVVTNYEGERYLVAMLGEGTNWVRNVWAAAGRATIRHGRREAVRLVEVAPGDRAGVLQRYLRLAPGARAHFPVDLRASLDEFEAIAFRYPVFQLRPEARMPSGDVTLDLSVLIERPPEDVFAVLADIQDHEPVPLDARVRMTKHPATTTCVGTRWDERVRIAPSAWLSITSVVTDIDPPRLLGMDFRTAWFTGHLTYAIDPTPEGSRLCQHETLRLRRRLGWAAPFVTRTLGARVTQRLDELKLLLERGP